MPGLSRAPFYASRVAMASTACVLLAGCGSGDLEPIQLADAGADASVEHAEPKENGDAGRVTPSDRGTLALEGEQGMAR